MRNLRLTIEYDGTNYAGWQVQPKARSVQGTIERALSQILQEEVRLTSSGRTDAGVHALGQVANFFTISPIDLRVLQRGVNALLPKDIAVKEIREEDLSFHARFSARSRVYLYRILNHPIRSGIERLYSWHVPEEIDIERMREATPFLIGEHDFSSFRGAECKADPRRELKRLNINKKGCIIEIEMEANAFLQHMARIIVATLVDVGRGKLAPEDVKEILEAKDRSRASKTAPPQGLFLKEVIYGGGSGRKPFSKGSPR